MALNQSYDNKKMDNGKIFTANRCLSAHATTCSPTGMPMQYKG